MLNNFSPRQFKPIIFSTPMVEAIEAGRKTQTRRLINPQPNGSDVSKIGGTKNYSIFKPGDCFQIKPKFNIGDILWVREKWRHNDTQTGFPYHHYADDSIYTDRDNEKWKPSLFMPKQACRLFLEITDVRVERLNDISLADCINEGIGVVEEDVTMYVRYSGDNKDWGTFSAIESYKSLWQKINGVESWEANPYVWVITFKLVECPQCFC